MFRIYNLLKPHLFLRSEIDSSGMDVYWVERENADTFSSKEDAEEFLNRVVKRFPGEKFGIEAP